ncbi:MAG: ABC transporter permease [Eubacteriales bacterium]|nr:ABC transporter permease [Eubacteriales bacterium]
MKRILIILALLLVISLLPQQANFPTNIQEKFKPMSLEHPLGTDYLGRDLFKLMSFGFKRSAEAVLIASVFALSLGLLAGLYAGYKGGIALAVLEFFANLGLILPSFIVALIISAYFGFTPLTIGLSLGLFDLSAYAIQVATLTRKVKEEEFILMSQLLGLSKWRILKRHIFHHIFEPVSALFANKASSIVLRYASLAFLGLGADVTKPDWGMLLYEYRIYFIDQPQLLLWPSLGIFAFCLFFHLLFDRKEVFKGAL